MKNLYLLSTAALGDYYVIASDPTDAQNFLVEALNSQNYGYFVDRVVTNIKLVAMSAGSSLQNKSMPCVSDRNKRLLIVEDWK